MLRRCLSQLVTRRVARVTVKTQYPHNNIAIYALILYFQLFFLTLHVVVCTHHIQISCLYVAHPNNRQIYNNKWYLSIIISIIIVTDKVNKTEQEWKKTLNPEEYYVWYVNKTLTTLLIWRCTVVKRAPSAHSQVSTGTITSPASTRVWHVVRNCSIQQPSLTLVLAGPLSSRYVLIDLEQASDNQCALQPLKSDVVEVESDESIPFMPRTEVKCSAVST